jgi:hypothetical protein
MLHLHKDWFTQGWVDFELKKYTLLAYLQDVRSEFAAKRLYPVFGELIGHHENLAGFLHNKQKMQSAFPRDLKGLDLETGSLLYHEPLQDDPAMAQLSEIVEYSLPLIRDQVEEGKNIYELIEKKIEIDVVGVMPLYRDEGYFLLKKGRQPDVNAYLWQATVITKADERYRAIRTEFIGNFRYSITNTFEQIKMDLVKSRKEMPNPATYSLVSPLEIPEQEAFLPIARRKFMRFLASA